jgi:hypothetical protein
MSKLLMFDVMTGVRSPFSSLFVCEFSIACHFVYVLKEKRSHAIDVVMHIVQIWVGERKNKYIFGVF